MSIHTLSPEALAVSIPKLSSTVPTRFALLAYFFAMGHQLDSVYQLTGPYIVTQDPACIHNHSLVTFSRLIGDSRNLCKIYKTEEGALWLKSLIASEAAAVKGMEAGL